MNQKMTSTTNNHKKPTVLVTIAALAAALLASAEVLGSGQMALAGKVNITRINIPTDTQQKQECETASGNSPISGSCTANSHDTIAQSGGLLGELKK
jgi:hypothetical protein